MKCPKPARTALRSTCKASTRTQKTDAPYYDAVKVFLARKDGAAEVVRAINLAESRARHDHYTRRVQQPKAVKCIRRFSCKGQADESWQPAWNMLCCLTRGCGCRHRLGREADAWEEVQRTLRWLARDAFHPIECVVQLNGAALERSEDAVALGAVAVVRHVARRWRAGLQPDGNLANNVAAIWGRRSEMQCKLARGRPPNLHKLTLASLRSSARTAGSKPTSST